MTVAIDGRARPRRGLMQRGIDRASEAADILAEKLSRIADPRARLLRKRRWALRLSAFFGAASLFWVLVTAMLAAWATPVWVLLITGVIAAGAVAPATLLLLRYRWLRSVPLPARRPGAARRLPSPRSAARPAMAALGASERGMFSLLGVLERGQLLPAGELADLAATANRTAAAMVATAAEVASMERAAQLAPEAGAQLAPTINAFTAQLASGVRQYNEMVTAAAQLVASTDSPMSRQRYRGELADATDRLVGWAQAFDELGRSA